MLKFFCTFLAICFFLVPGSARADVRALLVGVGDYAYLDADLRGPINDVGLMARTLMHRGVSGDAIVVLSDAGADVPGDSLKGLPDRAAILEQFDLLLAESNAGDTLIFYFSGHGAQAPDQDGDEGGGLDEIFLPRDAKGWNGAIGEVENAIRDDDFGALAQKAAAKGVKLVAILDACHSGTGFRALGQPKGQARYITPESLGVPTSVEPSDTAAPSAPRGDFVYLYAAQSDQRAFEYPLSDGETERWHGDFTRALTTVLREEANLSWASLVELASNRMAARSGQAVQTPDIEGTLSADPVPGSDAPGLTRVAVDGVTLKAGILEDVTEGSTYTLYAGLSDAEPIGQGVVESVSAQTATLRYLDPVPTVKVTHAELSARAPDVTVTVSLSPEAAERLEDLRSGAEDVLRASLDFPLLPSGAPTDYTVILADDAFVWIGADGILDADGPGSSPRLALAEGNPVPDLVDGLTANVARARLDRALAQVGSSGTATSFSLLASGPKVVFSVQPGRPAGRSCRPEEAPKAVVAERARASHCDIVEVEVTNPTSKMQDVTVLYSDPAAGVTMLWPTSNLSNRLESGAVKTLRFGIRNDSEMDILRESLIVLSVPAAPGSVRTVFAGLQSGGALRGANGPMAGFLAGLTNPSETSRSLLLSPAGGSLEVNRLNLLISPAGAE